jgi:hypothetical protein
MGCRLGRPEADSVDAAEVRAKLGPFVCAGECNASEERRLRFIKGGRGSDSQPPTGVFKTKSILFPLAGVYIGVDLAWSGHILLRTTAQLLLIYGRLMWGFSSHLPGVALSLSEPFRKTFGFSIWLFVLSKSCFGKHK